MKTARFPARLLPGFAILWLLFSAVNSRAAVKMWEDTISIPTYLAGDPEPSPMFYFGRASQGAEGRVYPYPLYDSLTNIKSNKTYRIVYLENEYVRIGILPEIGGRLFEAVDKSNGYNFIYRQHVIKPALIGLIGAWISGGIEWNIPHHHRATTFLPVQCKLEENPDGSKTIWVGELEIRDRMRWAVGYTLHPGKSYLECKLRIVNRTPFANTMLCFANVAVHANNQYQVIFPPNTQFVTFHSKREFANWPIATTRYNGADFTAGVDVSWYSNHFNANSMFAWNYEDDFFAGYDHGRNAGIISTADHHEVPGKKFWTWGNGPRGRMWDKILTDDDGPYIELMTGAFSDNQPDYSWLQPYETKSFEMYWYPFRDLDGVKKANVEAAVNLEVTNDVARVGFCTTSPHNSATVTLKAGDKVLLEERVSINPAKPYLKQVSIPKGLDAHELRASISDGGRELVAYSPVHVRPALTPAPAGGAPPPADIKSVEELYLTGQRIEQFRAPGGDPEPYWQEALKRDPGDARVNTVMGIRRLRQARFADAEAHFRKAVERLSTRYTSPRDGEPFYYLGMTLKAQGKFDDAYDAFAKAAWSEAWRGPANFSLAEITSRRGDFAAALDFADRSLSGNSLNVRALTLKAAALRHLGRPKESLVVLDTAAHETDPLDVRIMVERWMAGDKKAGAELTSAMREHPNTGLETATEFGNAGLWSDGTALLKFMADNARDKTRIPPMTYYYLGQFAERVGDNSKAEEYRRLAAQVSPEYGFTFQWEAIHVLRRAMELNPLDARAPFYLGTLLYDWQPAEAIALWEKSASLDASLPMVHRNLGVAYAHAPVNDRKRAIDEYEKAVVLPKRYPMHFAELDELYAAAGALPEKRMALLEQNHATVLKRDDALSREIGLKVFFGKYDDAIKLMTGRRFAVWEGGTLDVADHWENAHIGRGLQAFAAGKHAAALAEFQAAKSIPDNLPNDRRTGGPRTAEFAMYFALAYEGLGDTNKARQSWQEATNAPTTGGGGRRGGGGAGALERQVQIFYQALAKRKLGRDAEGDADMKAVLDAGTRAIEQAGGDGSSDSQPGRQPPNNRLAMAHYVAGLGHLGLGDQQKAKDEFERALEASPDFLGPKMQLAALK